MKRLRYSLVLISLLLSGCGDFLKPLGNNFYWLRTNASNHIVIYDKDRDGHFYGAHDYSDPRNEYVIDSNAIKVNVVGSHILVYRVKTGFYDRSGSPPPQYGYHIIDKVTGNVRRSVSFKEIISFVHINNYKMPYTMCRQEGGIFECIGLVISGE